MQEKFATVLKASGSVEIFGKGGKYRRFTTNIPDVFYFLGRGGGFRIGRTVTSSIPVSNTHKARLLAESERLV